MFCCLQEEDKAQRRAELTAEYEARKAAKREEQREEDEEEEEEEEEGELERVEKECYCIMALFCVKFWSQLMEDIYVHSDVRTTQ